MVGIGKPGLPWSADLMKMGFICGFFRDAPCFVFFFLSTELPKEEGLTDVSSSLGPFAGLGTAGCMTSFRPQTQFCLELNNTPFDDGVPFPACINSRGLATPLAIPAAVPLWTVG